MSHREASERQARLDFLIESASKTFAVHGVEASSLDLIAREAEYTRRTLYSYFKGRDEIILSVFLRDLKLRLAFQENAIHTLRGGLNKLIRWADSFLSYSLQNPDSLRLQAYVDYKSFNRERIDDGLIKEYDAVNERLADQLRSVFMEGVRDGCFIPGLDLDLCVSLFDSSIRAILNRTLSEDNPIASVDPEYYFFSFLGLFIRGIERN